LTNVPVCPNPDESTVVFPVFSSSFQCPWEPDCPKAKGEANNTKPIATGIWYPAEPLWFFTESSLVVQFLLFIAQARANRTRKRPAQRRLEASMRKTPNRNCTHEQ
jgi:hypothetical protein